MVAIETMKSGILTEDLTNEIKHLQRLHPQYHQQVAVAAGAKASVITCSDVMLGLQLFVYGDGVL